MQTPWGALALFLGLDHADLPVARHRVVDQGAVAFLEYMQRQVHAGKKQRSGQRENR